MNDIKRPIFILIFSFLLSLSLVNAAATNISECEIALSEINTTYTLNKSVSVWNSDCISINATNVTLDCLGYTITYGGNESNPYAIDNEEGYDNITIKNCIITQNGTGPAQHAISFVGSENAIIFNNTITTFGGLSALINGSRGIFLDINSTNANITSNTINTSGTYGIGIFLGDSDTGNINNNIITTSGDYADAIRLDSSVNNSLSLNNITTSGNTAAGIYTLMNCSFSIAYNNTIITSGTNQSYGIYLDDDAESMNVSSNTITTSGGIGYGISVQSKNNELVSNTILTAGNESHGFYLANGDSNLCYGNSIITTGSGGDGIYINLESYNNLTNNVINTSNGFAIWVAGLVVQDYNHTIVNNTEQGIIIDYLFNNNSGVIENKNVGEIIAANSYNLTLNNLTLSKDGITFIYTNNSLIKNSYIALTGAGIGWGIGISASHSNNMTNNTIITSGAEVDGIYIEGSNHSVFTQNKIHIVGNNSFVVYTDSSGNNTFYDNLFNASTINSLSTSGFGYQGNSAPTDFVWNTSKTAGTNIIGKSYIGGNFWTNNESTGYSNTCTDTNGDYICDTPYSFDNTDGLPLTMYTSMVSNATVLNITNKYYILNQSITNVRGTCFVIAANNITLDFNGFNVTGNTTGYGINITGYNDTKINNAYILNFSTGIYISSSSGNVFVNATVEDSNQDAVYLTGTDSSNNNFTSSEVIDTNSSCYDIRFNTAGINGTWITDSIINSYIFTGIGGIVNVKITGYAMVKFLEPINGSGANFTTGDFNLDNNLLFVNSSINSGLNRSAEITLYSITYTDPKPQYSNDGAAFTDCTAATDPACNEISFSGNAFVFNTTHFTTFRSAESYTSPSGGGGNGGGISPFWIETYMISDEQFVNGYTKELKNRHRIMFNINGNYRFVGIIGLTETTAPISTLDETAQTTLRIGGDKKVDLTNDGFYDVYIKLSNIIDDKANITIQKLHEEILEIKEEPIAAVKEKKSIKAAIPEEKIAENQYPKKTEKNAVWPWILLISLVVIIGAWYLRSLIIKKKKVKAE